MKLLFSGLSMLLIVFLLCIFNQMYLKASLENIMRDLDKVSNKLNLEKWESVDDILTSILEGWFAKKEYYTCVIFHEQIGDVELALIELQCNIEARDQTESIKSVKVAQVSLEKIIFNEVFSLASLF